MLTLFVVLYILFTLLWGFFSFLMTTTHNPEAGVWFAVLLGTLFALTGPLSVAFAIWVNFFYTGR